MPVQGRAQRRAQRAVRLRRRPRRRSCASCRRTPTSRSATCSSRRASTAPIRRASPSRRSRRSSATPARCSRASRCTPLAGVDRSEHLLVLAPPAALPPRPEEPADGRGPREGRRARRDSAAAGRIRDGAAEHAAAASRPRGPRRSCGRSNPWFIVLTLRARAARATCCPLTGVGARAAARLPRAGAALLVHPGAALRRRRRRVDAWASLMDVGDATLFGQHALAYAVLAYAAEYFRRRVLRFPLWQQAAQVAVLLAAVRGARAAGARRRRRAAAALDLLRCRRSSARCCGRCSRCCCSGRSARALAGEL